MTDWVYMHAVTIYYTLFKGGFWEAASGLWEEVPGFWEGIGLWEEVPGFWEEGGEGGFGEEEKASGSWGNVQAVALIDFLLIIILYMKQMCYLVQVEDF